jgi:hypothetical protein
LKLILFRFFILVLQSLLIAILPPTILLGLGFYHALLVWDGVFNSIIVNVCALFLSTYVKRRLGSHPQAHLEAFILPVTLWVYLILLFILFMFHAPYSVKIILMGFVQVAAFLALTGLSIPSYKQSLYFVIPLGDAQLLKTSDRFKFINLTRPLLPNSKLDGVVADLHSGVLNAEWERFLAQCALKRIPVLNSMHLNEAISGKVSLDHLSENEFGELAPSVMHMNIKMLSDILFLILISPVILPLMLLIALWIRADSPGGALFIQERMGYKGEPFKMVKFRTMVVDHAGSHFTEADESHRITRVGKIIRKLRLDELPQFWNVLRGEMSLIGPRPESMALARWYEMEVPFFNYRHVLRPGISGWAQVKQGYAAGVDEMKEKVAYDFYYIKHFSVWLDMLIWHKTIRTVLTGFGSR